MNIDRNLLNGFRRLLFVTHNPWLQIANLGNRMFRAPKEGLHLLFKLKHPPGFIRKFGFQVVYPRNRFRSAFAQNLHLLLKPQTALGLLRKPRFQVFHSDGGGIGAFTKGLHHYSKQRSMKKTKD